MKNIFLSLLFLLSTYNYSQQNFNQFSLEAGYGYVSPLNGFSEENGSSFSAFKNFDFGVRYMFNQTVGVKVGYSNSKFESNRNNSFGTKMNTINLQGYLNLAHLLNFKSNFSDNFGLLFHSGVGYSTMFSNLNPGQDQIYSFMGGLTPQYKLSDRIAFYIDFSYFYNTSHDFYYDGMLNTNDKKFNTQMYTISLGLIFNLGGNSSHADWY
jgi:OOP family OmpA-OmpF porin